MFRVSFHASRLRTLLIVTFAVTGILISAQAARAQTHLDVVHTFDPQGPIHPTAGLIQAADGNFYGTSDGPPGTVFRMTPAGTVTILHAFVGAPTDGARPEGALIQPADGNFYGTTLLGGTSDNGTVFKMTPGGTVTILHSFNARAEGGYPHDALIQGTDGNFYGTIPASSSDSAPCMGFTSNCGSIFRMTPGGTVTILHTFAGGTDGAFPSGPLIQAPDGNFYGTTTNGGSGGAVVSGTVFQMTPAGAVTIVHRFTGGLDGALPRTALVRGTDGNFYGTTLLGGTSDNGTVFRMTPDGTVTTLHSFSEATLGFDAFAGLIQATDGNFYGTTYYGGTSGCGTGVYAGCGTVFQMTPAGIFTVLHMFGDGTTDGAYPIAVIQATDGNFYGTANSGGTYNHGTIFTMTSAGTFTVLSVLNAGADGANPQASLIRAPDGNFFGTTMNGGAFNLGTVFNMTPGGIVTVLHMFAGGNDGASPGAALIRATDGNFYGTTTKGGAFDRGTVFKITPGGVVTTLHAFAGGTDGDFPSGPLIQATDGNFYGTTEHGGMGSTSDSGTFFKMTPGGTVTVLHAFDYGTDGSSPRFLIQATDGNFYGTTFYGYPDGGRAFRLTANGTVTILHSFDSFQEGVPFAGLIQATDGNFYGTTVGIVTDNFGAVFKMTPAGIVTILHTFAGGTDGGFPSSPLIQATDGTFYGTTVEGGACDTFAVGCGTVFKMTPDGAVSIVHRFAGGLDGVNPQAALLQAANGTFYGTTYSGGASGMGVVFRLGPPAMPPAAATPVAPSGVISTNHPTFTWTMVAEATLYNLLVNNASGTPIIQTTYDTSVCGTRTCSVTPVVPLSDGMYTWRVQTWNSAGFGPQSSPLTFVTSTPRDGDFDGDHKADIAVFRPSNGAWYVRGATVATTFGGAGDIPVARDYDGDGQIDVAVFRPVTGAWYIWQSSTLTGITYTWGGAGDIPVPADYDGDGKTDIAVFRPSTGVWYIWRSRTQTGISYTFGVETDVPVPRDFDGDGKADIAVFRPATGAWYIWQSRTLTGITYTWGGGTDIPVPADYDGDGKSDIAVFRPGAFSGWYIWQSGSQTGLTYAFGGADDIPVPGDYDGDGKTDIALFRPTTGTWYIWQSATQTGFSTTWGGEGDIPILKRP